MANGEVQEVLACARGASSLGPEGGPYRVYIGASDVLKYLEAQGGCMKKRNNSEEMHFHSKGEETQRT